MASDHPEAVRARALLVAKELFSPQWAALYHVIPSALDGMHVRIANALVDFVENR